MRVSSSVGSARRRRAWSGWVATTTWSKGSAVPSSVVISTPSASPADAADRRGGADGVQLLGHALDIGAGATGDGPPDRGAADREHAVVVEEAEEVAGRIAHRGHRVAGPDRRHHGRQEVRGEVRREAAACGELPQGQRVRVRSAVPQQPPGQPVEAGHGGEHPRIGGVAERGRAGEETGRAAGPRVLQAASLAPDGHAHLRLLRGHAEFGEEPQQVRVGAPVVHDEAGVDVVDAAVGPGQVVGVRVAAHPVVRLEQRHVMGPSQDVGGREPRHPAAHDGRASPPVAHCAPSGPAPTPSPGGGGAADASLEVIRCEPLGGLAEPGVHPIG